MKKLNLLIIFFFAFLVNAQTITGKVLSLEENQPIPYAKIGIENEDFGTIADKNGNFTIDLTDIDKTKNLKIEVGGFEKYSVSVAQFLKENHYTIFLNEKVKIIEEVKINPKKYVDRNWGVNTKSRRMLISHNPSKEKGDKSKEIAMLFNTNKKTKIEKININIPFFKSDKPVFIRFTIYDKNLNSTLDQDLTDEITSDKLINNTYTFDVSKKSIWVNDDFYIGFQILNNFKGALFMSAALLGNKTIYRKYLGEWENVPVVSPAINIDVKVQK